MIAVAVAPLIPFSSTEKVEAIIVVVVSCVSAAAVLITLIRAALAALRPGKRDSKAAIFFKTQLGYYAAALLLANLVGALSGIFEVAWVGRGGIVNNSLCSTQATLIQIGNFGSAYFTTATAIHTFNALVLKNHPKIWMSVIIILIGMGASVAVGLAVPLVMEPIHGSFYGDIGLFCAVSAGYTVAQFISTFLPIIVAAFTSSLLYSIIYLCMRGTLEFKQGIRINLSEENALNRLFGREEYRRFVGTVIKSMLWYPFSYTVLLIPLTIVGLMRISGMNFPDGLLAFGIIFASLQGTANVLILNRTLKVLRPAFSTPAGSVKSESFFVVEERKPSPIEAPTSASTFSPNRAFPPPISNTSRAPSPMNRSISRSITQSPYRPYAKANSSFSPSSSTDDLFRPPVTAPLLRHHRSENSNLSISSMTELLAPEHRRTQSRSDDGMTSAEGSVSAHIVVPTFNANSSPRPPLAEPIMEPEVLKTKLVVRNPSNSLPTSPRSGLGLSPTPSISLSPAQTLTAGLSPAPRRPTRSAVLRESLLNTFASMQAAIESHHHRQPQSTPQFLDVDPMSAPAAPGRNEQRMSSINDARSIYSFYERSDPEEENIEVVTQEYDPYSEYPEEDFEIRTVDSRTTVRPSISAVAGKVPLALSPGGSLQMRRKSSRRRPSEEVILEVESEDAGSAESSAGVAAAMIPPPRQDSVPKDQANLSKLAWASLVTSAALAPSTERPSPVDIPAEERDWRVNTPSPAATEKSTRFSAIPMSLRPGTPRTAPADGSYSFVMPSPSKMPQGVISSSGAMFRPDGSQGSEFIGRALKTQRSFNVDRRPDIRRGPSYAVSRSNTASPAHYHDTRKPLRRLGQGTFTRASSQHLKSGPSSAV